VASSFTIIVNTSDSYSDCWAPFFTLFERYWPECDARVLLNTELATFAPGGVAVESTRVQEGSERRLTWSECLLRCLDQVRTPLVLYMQEDYFLEERVDAEAIAGLAERMITRADIGQIGLTAFGAYGPFEPTADADLWKVHRRSRYRTSLQGALWRVDTLRSYLRPEENGWMFEIYGTQRSRRRNDLFLTVNRDAERRRRVLPYSLAGIVKGKWHVTVPALFAREGIEMDFSRRGFFAPRHPALEKVRTLGKLMEHPRQLVRGLAGR
jgi:hypothetical protein